MSIRQPHTLHMPSNHNERRKFPFWTWSRLNASKGVLRIVGSFIYPWYGIRYVLHMSGLVERSIVIPPEALKLFRFWKSTSEWWILQKTQFCEHSSKFIYFSNWSCRVEMKFKRGHLHLPQWRPGYTPKARNNSLFSTIRILVVHKKKGLGRNIIARRYTH